MELKGPGPGQFRPQGMTDRIYVGDHLTLLHAKYLSSGPSIFREEDFLRFSHCKSKGAYEPRGVANFDPRGMVGRIYVGHNLTLLHTTYFLALCFMVSE